MHIFFSFLFFFEQLLNIPQVDGIEAGSGLLAYSSVKPMPGEVPALPTQSAYLSSAATDAQSLECTNEQIEL